MLVCARIKRHRGRRTSCPSLVNPVRISGPFCYGHLLVSICRELRKVYGQRTVSRAIATGRPAGLAVQSRQYVYAPFRTRLDHVHTCNGLPCVVDDALMVFVRAMREVHANWTRAPLGTRNGTLEGRDDGYEPMFTPAFLSSMSFSTLFVFGPAYSQLSQRLFRYSRST